MKKKTVTVTIMAHDNKMDEVVRLVSYEILAQLNEWVMAVEDDYGYVLVVHEDPAGHVTLIDNRAYCPEEG